MPPSPSSRLLVRLLVAATSIPLSVAACDGGDEPGSPADGGAAGASGNASAGAGAGVGGAAGMASSSGLAGAPAAGGGGSAGASDCCVGKRNPVPEGWASTERSPAYACDPGYPTPTGCCAKFDQCFTPELLAPFLPAAASGGQAGSDGAAGGDGSWRCPSPGEFAKTDGFAICRGDMPIAARPSQGGLCCYTFDPGGCCGRPLLHAGAPRVASRTRTGAWC